jgi:hypothetical protein
LYVTYQFACAQTCFLTKLCLLNAQVEELVAGSNTGKSPQLAGYYSYWEMAVFNALVLMVLRALEKLHTMLSSAKKPLFKVSICMSTWCSHNILPRQLQVDSPQPGSLQHGCMHQLT